ncbi:MAG: type pilus assembly protein PilM [Acidobacteriota bacterium]|nr:type pilus assembly protein PilM [Acidobacteriota bacterium]
MRSTKLPSWTSSGLNGFRKLLGYDPVPAPPHAFSLDGHRLRYGQFVRDRQGYRLRNWRQAPLPPDSFHSGLLGGPLRDPAAFTALVGSLVQGAGGGNRGNRGIRDASLVVPDAWLRVSFSEITDVPRQAEARDEVLRWKLRRLVPFRVDELRVGAAEVEPLPVQEEPRRLLLGFGVEQLLAQVEDAFAAHHVHIGRITSASLALLSAVEIPPGQSTGGFSAVVQVEPEGYTLIFARGGEPVLHRYKPFTGGMPEGPQVGFVTRDLKLTRNFLHEHFPGSTLDPVLLLAPPEEEQNWMDRLREGLGEGSGTLSIIPIDGRSLPSLRSEDPVAPPWREIAPMLGAVRQEVA